MTDCGMERGKAREYHIKAVATLLFFCFLLVYFFECSRGRTIQISNFQSRRSMTLHIEYQKRKFYRVKESNVAVEKMVALACCCPAL